MGVTLNYIGNIYFEKGLTDKACEYYKQALDTAIQYSYQQVELLSYQNLVNIYKASNDYKNAFDYYENFITLKDKLYSQDKDKTISELQIKYETEKKERENEILRKSEKINNLIIISISILSIISLVFAGFVWHLMRIKNRSNKILEEKNREITNKNSLISEHKEELQTQADDLFEHKEHLEQIVEARTAELQKAIAQAEESDKLKTEFFNNLSHEIRTPLNAIVGFVNIMIADDISDEERKGFFKIIQQSSDQLLKTINDILEISELNTKQSRLYKRSVSLDGLFRKLKANFQTKAIEKNIALKFNETTLHNEEGLFTDEYRLEKILSKLIGNALKFTDTGYIEISYSTNVDSIEFYVKDTGIGIDDKNKQKIFMSFSKENTELSRDFGGLGIGLAIAKENVKLLGGKINFNSEKGKGATFYFTIPIE
jgi:signal transduction histidine kinase